MPEITAFPSLFKSSQLKVPQHSKGTKETRIPSWQVKPQLVMLASYIRILGSSPARSAPAPTLANVPGKPAENGQMFGPVPSTWETQMEIQVSVFSRL